MLDLTHILMIDHDIARFATKREAWVFARARGWNSYDVMRAFNRFNIFWTVGERLGDGIRLATRKPGTTVVPHRPSDGL